MSKRALRGALASSALALSLGLLATASAQAGVPRACIHPAYDPIACAYELRREHLDVLPSARLRELREQGPWLRRVAPLQDLERNFLLEEIRDELRACAPLCD